MTDTTKKEGEKLVKLEERLRDSWIKRAGPAIGALTFIAASIAYVVIVESRDIEAAIANSEEPVAREVDSYSNLSCDPERCYSNTHPNTLAKMILEDEAQEVITSDMPYNLLGAFISATNNNPHYKQIPEEYRSLIILDPMRVGVRQEVLRTDPKVVLRAAAQLYSRIIRDEPDQTKAIAIFFAGEEAVERALEIEGEEMDAMKARSGQCAQGQHMCLQRYLAETPINWVENLEPWQSSAVYITLRYIQTPEESEQNLQRFHR